MAARKKKRAAPRRGSKPARLVRAERALRDREALREVRKHLKGYEAKDGWDMRQIEQMPAHARRSLRKKYTELSTRLARPHVLLKAKDDDEAKVLRRETGQRLHDAKHFIVQVPDPLHSTARVEEGRLAITTEMPGRAEYDEQLFRWPKRPTSPEEMVEMLQAMELPTTGTFYLQTSRYGDILPDAGDKQGLVQLLRTYLRRYDDEKYGVHRFMDQVIGFRWARTKLAGEVIEQRRGRAREAQRELNRERRYELEAEARKKARAAKKS